MAATTTRAIDVLHEWTIWLVSVFMIIMVLISSLIDGLLSLGERDDMLALYVAVTA